MTNTKKMTRFFTVFALIFAMVMAIGAVPVSAAGVEDWYAAEVTEPTMHVYGTNLTPVKTLKAAGNLTITADFKLTDTTDYSDIAMCVVEIRSINGTVLERTAWPSTFLTAKVIVRTRVTVGQQVQIFTSVYDKDTGAKRYTDITYSHKIS